MIQLAEITDEAVAFGLQRGPGGAHGNRTMMLAELSLLFEHSEPDTPFEALRDLVVEQNVLLKSTAANRREVFTRLGILYGLRSELPIYRALRRLWCVSPTDRALLSLLVALGRDSLLRATAPVVLEAAVGEPIGAGDLANAVDAAFPGHYSAIGKASISRHASSSWSQSGHLARRSHKVRDLVQPGFGAIALALALGNVTGARGIGLYDTFWMKALDASPGMADSLAVEAYRRGLIDYKRLGNVLEVGLAPLTEPARGVA